ncbi:MAG TPA: hypothetical protein VK327_05540, partial [Candidatus Paceibacterota bacterium]|nr:hypothetical protein [Candidatus Paceibacterota bacterium]
TCRALWKLNPELKVVIASGSEHNSCDTEFRTKVTASIQKPYTVEKLLTTVQQALAKTSVATV